MSHGYVHVINNMYFDNLNTRHGSEVDVRRLRDFFEGVADWRFEVEDNKTAKEMKDSVQNLSEKDFSEYGALFLIILSHGNQYGICGKDGAGQLNVLTESDILPFFSARKCPSLAFKPKIFIFQACRGEMDDRGYIMSLTDGGSGHSATNYKINIPDFSEFLFVYPCIPGYTAVRNKQRGSYFVQALTEHLMERYKYDDLMRIMQRVNNTVAHQENQLSSKSMPCQDHRLTRLTYFHQYFLTMKNMLLEKGKYPEN